LTWQACRVSVVPASLQRASPFILSPETICRKGPQRIQGHAFLNGATVLRGCAFSGVRSDGGPGSLALIHRRAADAQQGGNLLQQLMTKGGKAPAPDSVPHRARNSKLSRGDVTIKSGA